MDRATPFLYKYTSILLKTHMSNYDTMFELLFEQIKNLSGEIEELREEVKKLKNTK